MRLIIIFYLTWILSLQSFAFSHLSNENQLKQNLKQIQNIKKIPNQEDIFKILQLSLAYINNNRASSIQIKNYKKIIDNFQILVQQPKIKKINLVQLNANDCQKLSYLRIELLKKYYNHANQILQIICNQLDNLHYKETKKNIKHNKISVEKINKLPESIKNIIYINQELSNILNQKNKYIKSIISKQHQISSQILQVKKTLINLREQSQWLDKSAALGEILRARISRLPDIPKQHKLDSDMAKLRLQRLHFEDLINRISQFIYIKQDDGSILTATQYYILDKQLSIQQNLLNNLLNSCDNQILELTKLKVANGQLEKVIKEIQDASHRYLFWVADVSPINLSYPIHIGQDLHKIFNIDNLNQIKKSFIIMLISQDVFIPLFVSLLLVICSFIYRKHYKIFLERSSNCVGKVNQDHFYLTLYNVFYSILIVMPLPVLLAILGYGLSHVWIHPIAVTIGDGIINTAPILWIFMICSKFASPKGLFIVHFGWPYQQVKRALSYYTLSIGMIIPLVIILISLNNYSEREYISTIGRLCFILLCICLTLVTSSFKRAGLILYLNKYGNSNNIINNSLWNLIIYAPIIAALSASLGYLSTAQILLVRLEKSVAIWFLLLIIYYIIRRWMFIQRRRIAFERAKQRRAEMLAQRARNNEEDLSQFQLNDVAAEVDAKILDLDTISTQSLQLVRSILTLVAFLSAIILCSELHSAFGFLENIVLWKISYNIKEVNVLQSITLGAVIIATLVFIITTQLVRNLPSLLELAILQHLDLAPGTGYAITTLTKYSLMLIGGIIGFSIIGIDWSKLQWLVAALGVGLGFGLQEIFANFISGLIILFEKPIRIGDTVTIRNLTGNITRINTRATTITDWDRKEIIVPNKAFITEQFVNWSLSDTVTRVVLNVPAPIGVNIEEITRILMQAAYRCPLVLKLPTPEAFLVDLQHGLPIFELRMYAAEMGHRMPLRHQVHKLIIESYKEHKMDLPFPTFQIYKDQIKVNDSVCNYIDAKNNFF